MPFHLQNDIRSDKNIINPVCQTKMAYNEKLTNRVREALAGIAKVEEKRMFRGITFMVDGKMCISAGDTRIMCRIDPALHEEAIAKKGCRTVEMKGRPYIGYVYVSEEGIKTKKDLDYWIGLALEFNKQAKASRKKTKK
jgi:TfoX/Sxy family transcriptional regulator of competence genes